MKIFLSYAFDPDHPEDEQFVHRVNYFLRKQPQLDSYCYAHPPGDPDWQRAVGLGLSGCDKFVLFVGRRSGKVQLDEVYAFLSENGKDPGAVRDKAVTVRLPGATAVPPRFFQFLNEPVEPLRTDDPAAEKCAQKLVCRFRGTDDAPWIADDGVPIGYPFDYEKVIIEEFVKGGGHLLSPRRLEQGCPRDWPEVERVNAGVEWDNPVEENVVGAFRPHGKLIIVAPRSTHPVAAREADPPGGPDKVLGFPEAGPRERLYYPKRNTLKVGVMVSGGIAPGINAVIDGIVERHRLYEARQQECSQKDARRWPSYILEVWMYRDGFAGLLRGEHETFPVEKVRDLADRGGSMIGTSRWDDLLQLRDSKKRDEVLGEVVNRLEHDRIEILYLIGGEGSMRAAHALWTKARSRGKTISIVGIPKTMDNDILWVWQSFGFLSAVERAKQAILQLHTEVTSNPRLCVMQLFGSDSGFVVSHAALASGVCDAALIPEVGFSMAGLSSSVLKKLHGQRQRGQSPHGLILLAETAIPQDVEDYIDNPRYPDLGLEEREREAIRQFVGSSLLVVSDVLSWRELCSRLHEEAAPPRVRRVRELLAHHAGALLTQAALELEKEPDHRPLLTELEKEPDLQSLLIRALNKVLREADLSGDRAFADLPRGRTPPPSREPRGGKMGRRAPPRKGGPSKKNRRDWERLQEVSREGNIPLSHDARALLKRAQGPRGGDLSPAETERLVRRLTESINRFFLEQALPGVIAKSPAARGERRVHGQTPDALRTGGLKIVSRVLQSDIRNPDLMPDPDRYWKEFRVFTNEPRHLLRAIPPSVSDVIFGHRLGTLAVDNAMAGYTDFMVSQWLTEYVLVPLKLVVLGRKRVPETGIFWRSVLANTGQSDRM